jgi:transcriptional regulator with XRE-family HTH domain
MILLDQFSRPSHFSTEGVCGAYTGGVETSNNNEYRYIGFGPAVRYYRRKAKVAQGELADRLGVGQTTVSRWERQHEPIDDPFMLFELADCLGVTPDDLREGRVRVGQRGRTMHDYIEDIIAVDAPEGVPIEELRELLDIAAGLSPRSLRALVEFGQFQQSRQQPKVVNNGDTSGDTPEPDGE